MSIATEQKVEQLLERVQKLEEEVASMKAALKPSRDMLGSMPRPNGQQKKMNSVCKRALNCEKPSRAR